MAASKTTKTTKAAPQETAPIIKEEKKMSLEALGINDIIFWSSPERTIADSIN